MKSLDSFPKIEAADDNSNSETISTSPKPPKVENPHKDQGNIDSISSQEQTPGTKLADRLRALGVESKTIKIENGGEFSEAIIFEKRPPQTEKLVRIYRVINHLDVSVLNQIPYAMRNENTSGVPTTIEKIKQEVDNLARNPTYDNLLTYVDHVQPYLNPDEIRRMNDELADLEKMVLQGFSVRKELVMRQIHHLGGYHADHGMTPYISASLNPKESANYGHKGLMVIDIPLSEIEFLGIHATEIAIKGALDPKYISAIIPRQKVLENERIQVEAGLDIALQEVSASIQSNLYSNDGLRLEQDAKIATEKITDKEQWKKDVDILRKGRTEKLKKRFPEVITGKHHDPINREESGIDQYTQMKQEIFDHYKGQLENIGRNKLDINDYEYNVTGVNENLKYDRTKIDETMLIKLRELVEAMEDRQARRTR